MQKRKESQSCTGCVQLEKKMKSIKDYSEQTHKELQDHIYFFESELKKKDELINELSYKIDRKFSGPNKKLHNHIDFVSKPLEFDKKFIEDNKCRDSINPSSPMLRRQNKRDEITCKTISKTDNEPRSSLEFHRKRKNTTGFKQIAIQIQKSVNKSSQEPNNSIENFTKSQKFTVKKNSSTSNTKFINSSGKNFKNNRHKSYKAYESAKQFKNEHFISNQPIFNEVNKLISSNKGDIQSNNKSLNLKSKTAKNHITETYNNKEKSATGKSNKTNVHNKKNQNINHTIQIYNFKNKSNQNIETKKVKNYPEFTKNMKKESDLNIQLDKDNLKLDHFIINKKIDSKDFMVASKPQYHNETCENETKSLKSSHLKQDDKEEIIKYNKEKQQVLNYKKTESVNQNVYNNRIIDYSALYENITSVKNIEENADIEKNSNSEDPNKDLKIFDDWISLKETQVRIFLENSMSNSIGSETSNSNTIINERSQNNIYKRENKIMIQNNFVQNYNNDDAEVLLGGSKEDSFMKNNSCGIEKSNGQLDSYDVDSQDISTNKNFSPKKYESINYLINSLDDEFTYFETPIEIIINNTGVSSFEENNDIYSDNSVSNSRIKYGMENNVKINNDLMEESGSAIDNTPSEYVPTKNFLDNNEKFIFNSNMKNNLEDHYLPKSHIIKSSQLLNKKDFTQKSYNELLNNTETKIKDRNNFNRNSLNLHSQSNKLTKQTVFNTKSLLVSDEKEQAFFNNDSINTKLKISKQNNQNVSNVQEKSYTQQKKTNNEDLKFKYLANCKLTNLDKEHEKLKKDSLYVSEIIHCDADPKSNLNNCYDPLINNGFYNIEEIPNTLNKKGIEPNAKDFTNVKQKDVKQNPLKYRSTKKMEQNKSGNLRRLSDNNKSHLSNEKIKTKRNVPEVSLNLDKNLSQKGDLIKKRFFGNLNKETKEVANRGTDEETLNINYNQLQANEKLNIKRHNNYHKILLKKNKKEKFSLINNRNNSDTNLLNFSVEKEMIESDRLNNKNVQLIKSKSNQVKNLVRTASITELPKDTKNDSNSQQMTTLYAIKDQISKEISIKVTPRSTHKLNQETRKSNRNNGKTPLFDKQKPSIKSNEPCSETHKFALLTNKKSNCNQNDVFSKSYQSPYTIMKNQGMGSRMEDSTYRPSHHSLSKSSIIQSIFEKRRSSIDKHESTGFYTDRSETNNFNIYDELLAHKGKNKNFNVNSVKNALSSSNGFDDKHGNLTGSLLAPKLNKEKSISSKEKNNQISSQKNDKVVGITDSILSKINTDALKFNTAKFAKFNFKKKYSDNSEIIEKSEELLQNSTAKKKQDLSLGDNTIKEQEFDQQFSLRQTKEDRRIVLGAEVSRLNKKISSNRSRRENSISKARQLNHVSKESKNRPEYNNSNNNRKNNKRQVNTNQFISKLQQKNTQNPNC